MSINSGAAGNTASEHGMAYEEGRYDIAATWPLPRPCESPAG